MPRPKNFSLEDRQKMMRERLEAKKPKGVPFRMANAELRSARLRAIRERMGMTQGEFAAMLKISEEYVRSLEGRRKSIAMTFVELAEIRLKQFLEEEAKHRPKTVVVIPKELALDYKLRARVIQLHYQGKTEQQIAQELVVRPEVVQYFVSRINAKQSE